MNYKRFEDLPVWQAAIDLADRIYTLTEAKFYSQSGDLKDQIRRASLSISNNIAEGFERGSTAELITFLYYARGSAGETRNMLRFSLLRLKHALATHPDLRSEISNLQSQIDDPIPLAESCSRQIRGWADHLQNTDIKGQRHLNDQARQDISAKKRAEDFRAKIRQTVRDARPELFGDGEEGGR